MPLCSFIQQPKQHPIEWFGEETFEHRDGTLATGVGITLVIWGIARGEKMERTCKMSSKLRAASFFISETLLWKRRMVNRPNVGT